MDYIAFLCTLNLVLYHCNCVDFSCCVGFLKRYFFKNRDNKQFEKWQFRSLQKLEMNSSFSTLHQQLFVDIWNFSLSPKDILSGLFLYILYQAQIFWLWLIVFKKNLYFVLIKLQYLFYRSQ